MRSSLCLSIILAAAAAGCAKAPNAPVCSPAASWASPAYSCVAPTLAVAETEPAPAPEPPPPPEPEPAPPADVIELREQVQFETGSPVLLEESKKVLDEAAQVMISHPEIKLVEIRGHTDGEGTPAFNQKLSDSRAAAVRKHMIGAGVAKERLRSKGFGEDQPIADNETPEGRAQNRRVELSILERE